MQGMRSKMAHIFLGFSIFQALHVQHLCKLYESMLICASAKPIARTLEKDGWIVKRPALLCRGLSKQEVLGFV